MHLTLAIHLLHWPSSPIHTRQNILFKLRCTSLHPQVPILPLCWSSSCPNILFKLHCGGHHTFIVATFTIGQNWIAGLQQCILNLNCAKKWSIWLLWHLWFFTRIWTRSQTEFSSDPYCSLRRASKSKGISRNAESMFPIGFLQGPCEMWMYSVNLEVTIHKVDKC